LPGSQRELPLGNRERSRTERKPTVVAGLGLVTVNAERVDSWSVGLPQPLTKEMSGWVILLGMITGKDTVATQRTLETSRTS